MKISNLLTTLLCLSATSAFAGARLETRADYQSSSYNDDAKALGNESYSTTQLTRARLNVNGEVTKEIRFNGRVDFLGTGMLGNYTNQTGAPSNFVEYGYISYKLMPDLVLSMGKLAAVGGGMENQYDMGDLYLISAINVNLAPPNAGGVGLTYILGDHTFDIQSMNDQSKDVNNQKAGATRSMTNAQWYGMFLDKKLQLIASYHTFKVKDQARNTTFAGVKYDAGFAVFDLDYALDSDKTAERDMTNFPGVTLAAGTNLEISGFIFDARVPVTENWKAIAKAEASTMKYDGTKVYTLNNYGVAAEYALDKDNNANFHLAYNNLNTKNEATSKTATENQIVAGFKVYADLLK